MNIARIGGLCAGLLLIATAAAQGHPSWTIQIISPVQAGSAGDISVRILTQKIADNIRQSMVVEGVGGSHHVVMVDAP